MLLIHPQFSPITAIKPCNHFKVLWPHGEISDGFLDLRQLIHYAQRDIQCRRLLLFFFKSTFI